MGFISSTESVYILETLCVSRYISPSVVARFACSQIVEVSRSILQRLDVFQGDVFSVHGLTGRMSN